jgi:hypothetical protein
MAPSRKLSILNIAVACCCLLALFGHKPALSQDATRAGNQEQQQKKDVLATQEVTGDSSESTWPPLLTDLLPTVLSTDFDRDLDLWELSDDGWRLDKVDDRHVLSQFRKQSAFVPEVRSPFHRAILKSHEVTDFQLDVKVRSTHPPYGHRDVCLFFGYQSPTQFYYVHLGELMDPHCNQIFIVNNQPRTRISRTTSQGTPWDDDWHHVRIVHKTSTGQIAVYFDDLSSPVMTAIDQTFSSGLVGLGSFDDTADWAEFRLRGVVSKKQEINPAGETEGDKKSSQKSDTFKNDRKTGSRPDAQGVPLE